MKLSANVEKIDTNVTKNSASIKVVAPSGDGGAGRIMAPLCDDGGAQVHVLVIGGTQVDTGGG